MHVDTQVSLMYIASALCKYVLVYDTICCLPTRLCAAVLCRRRSFAACAHALDPCCIVHRCFVVFGGYFVINAS